ncbi:MAG: hypothetical protein HPY89_05815 [Pelotomaculum sp.]|nr:hypothetical protein [Pelotomaculum sp.]
MVRQWYFWPGHLSIEQVIKCYREQFGRDPETVYRDCGFWWTEITVKGTVIAS